MALRQKHFTQHKFVRPGRSVFQRDGDFYKVHGLSPIFGQHGVERVPAWSSPISFPATPAHIAGAFYDRANKRYCFIDAFEGQGTDLRLCYFDSAWSASGWTTLVASHKLGGFAYRNVQYWDGYLWFIDSDGDVYRHLTYTAGPATLYDSTHNMRILCPVGNYMYGVNNDGKIYRSDLGGGVFTLYFTLPTPTDVRWMGPYRQYLLVVTRDAGGTFHLLRVAPYAALVASEIASTQHSSGYLDTANWSLNFALHDDYFWIMPGYFQRASSPHTAILHRFNGAFMEPITRQDAVYSTRLVSWRGKLLAVETEQGRATVYQLIGDQFMRLLDPPTVTSPYSYPKVWNLGEELVCTLLNTDDSEAPGLVHAGAGNLTDGLIITSAYDMGLPARPKRLNHITAITNVDASTDTDFKIIIRYRLDDNCFDNDASGWTTAVTANATPRAVTAELGVQFYLLQVRVDVDDDTGNNLDRRIEAITIDYSAGN